MIINRANKRVYLGGAANLAQRKGEHSLNLSNPNRITKLQLPMRDDLKIGTAENFYFVPIIFFNTNNVIKSQIAQDSYNQQVASFLDNYVERLLLEYYLTSNLQQVFYNVKTVGTFEIGNTFGSLGNGGLPPNAISYKKYAWESVSAAANTFNVDRKLIREKRNNGIMFAITTEEFNNFSGVKITNADALEFSKAKPKEYNVLLAELFPNVAKKRASNGEL